MYICIDMLQTSQTWIACVPHHTLSTPHQPTTEPRTCGTRIKLTLIVRVKLTLILLLAADAADMDHVR